MIAQCGGFVKCRFVVSAQPLQPHRFAAQGQRLPVGQQAVEQKGLGHAGVVEAAIALVSSHARELIDLLRPALAPPGAAAKVGQDGCLGQRLVTRCRRLTPGLQLSVAGQAFQPLALALIVGQLRFQPGHRSPRRPLCQELAR